MSAAPSSTDAFIDAWRHYSRAVQKAKVRHGNEGELSLAQALLLNPLQETPAMTVGALAERAEVAKPTATRMLDALERAGYVDRRQDDADRRAVRVSLTKDGERVLLERWAAFRAGLERTSDALSPDERERATALLRRLADLMDEI